MNSADIVIVGSGSLASGVAYGFSQHADTARRIAIVGRSPAKVARLAIIANARAGILRTATTFQPVAISEFNVSALARLFGSLQPKVIFQAATLQSPWETGEGRNAWTELLASAGFGVTLPLQMALIAEISRAAGDSEAAIVNASYPDCVNVALHHLGLRVTCGIGNSAIVEALCRASPQRRDRDIRVIGHHGHLAAWLAGKRASPQPRIWIDHREVRPHNLCPKPGSFDEELNQVTSCTTVALLHSLLSGKPLHTSIPGVAGLPGGYPFLFKNGKFTLRLPPRVALEAAIAHNKTGERSDGLALDATAVQYLGKARHALTSVKFEYAEGFALADWRRARDRLLQLRHRLRSIAG